MNIAGFFRWTPEAEAQLRHLWDVEGKSSGEIRTIMGLSSRNTVIGKVSRMKLSKRRIATSRTYSKPKPRPSRAKHREPRPTIQKPLPVDDYIFSADTWNALPNTSPVSLVDLSADTCRWPVGGDARTPCTGFCGAKAMHGKPYCLEHTTRAIGKGSSFERDAVAAAKFASRKERKFGHTSQMVTV